MIREWIGLQVDEALLRRLDALIPRVGLRRHDVVRRAILAGLDALERQRSLPELGR